MLVKDPILQYEHRKCGHGVGELSSLVGGGGLYSMVQAQWLGIVSHQPAVCLPQTLPLEASRLAILSIYMQLSGCLSKTMDTYGK